MFKTDLPSGQYHLQNLSASWGHLERFLAQHKEENSAVVHVGLVSLVCQNCPYLGKSPNCNQCNRWNQQE